MKISLAWIREFVDCGDSPDEFAAHLIQFGIEIASRESLEDDTIFEIEVTANRPDLLSHYGVARELAAGLGRKLQVPDYGDPIAAGGTYPIAIQTGNCGRYAGLVLRGVNVAPSPNRISRRLESVGHNAITNIVDATNYELLELNHPVHAFDLDRIDGGIIVRQAHEGERIVLLDKKEYILTIEDMVIADHSRALALAGIMGGEASSVTSATKNVLLEAAWFSPASVRRTAKRLRISTDSSYRFERRADPEAPLKVIGRLAKLIQDTAGGEIDGGINDVISALAASREIPFRSSSVTRLLGHEVTGVENILTSIGCRILGERVAPPSWRGDLEKEVDLVEEIARHDGFDRIGLTLPKMSGHSPDFCAVLPTDSDPSAFRSLRSRIVRACFADGLDQCCTFSFEKSCFGEVEIDAPINDEMNRMRFSLVPALCRVAQIRIDRAGTFGAGVFELDKIFYRDGEVPSEEFAIAAVICGTLREKRYDQRPAERASIDHVIGLFGALARSIRQPLTISADAAQGGAHGRMKDYYKESAAVLLGGECVGVLGELEIDAIIGERSAASAGISNFFALELSVTAIHLLSEKAPNPRKFTSLSRFPASLRDIAFVVPISLAIGDVLSAVNAAAPGNLENVAVFDIFEMKGGREKSVGVRLTFRSLARTLTEEEIVAAVDAISGNVVTTCGASIRS